VKTKPIALALAGLALLTLLTAAASPLLRGMIGAGSPSVPIYTVERTDFVHRVHAEGNLKAVEATLLGPPPEVTESLKIAWLAENGSPVDEGDVVIRFDPTDMEENLRRGKHDRATAESKIVQKQAAVEATRSNLDRDAAMASLELDYAQRFQNKDRQVFSRAEIIESEIDHELAERKRDHAAEAGEVQSELAQTELDLLSINRRQAEIKIEHAQKGLRALEVRAPHGGIFVLKERWGRTPEVGQMVWGGNAIAELPQLGQMEAEVFVLEADAGGLEQDLPASLVIEAHPDRTYEARVKSVDAVAQRRNRRVPVQYFRVILELSETDTKLMKPGQRVRAQLTLAELGDVLAVPRQAIFESEGEKVVYRRGSEGFELVRVELGAAALGRVVVTAGLEPGDRIALRDPQRSPEATGEGGAAAAGGPMGAGG
jgi:multidrug efflux pump subunit AcrA (membrane-fusion protein)